MNPLTHHYHSTSLTDTGHKMSRDDILNSKPYIYLRLVSWIQGKQKSFFVTRTIGAAIDSSLYRGFFVWKQGHPDVGVQVSVGFFHAG